MKHCPDQDVADNRRSVRRRARQMEQRQRRALREQGQQLLERAGRVMGRCPESTRKALETPPPKRPNAKHTVTEAKEKPPHWAAS